MKIESLIFNWFYTPDGEFFSPRHVGFRVGNKTCVQIEEHLPQGDGDRLYYDVIYDDHSKERVFNPNQVFYMPEVFKNKP